MVKVAVIGLGRMGQSHAKNIKKVFALELVAVCDNKIKTASAVAQELNVPIYTDDIEDILKDETIEAVVITTSTVSHFDVVMRSLEAKKAIFIEKPITVDIEEAYEIKEKVEELKAFCQVGFMRRFDRDYAAAKKIIDSGEIGDPIYFKAISRDPDLPPLDFISRSGGIFTDLSVHDYDLARFLMNSEVKAVSSFGSIIKYKELEEYGDIDQGSTFLEFENGAIGDVESSRCAYYGYDIRTEIIGTKGTLQIGNLQNSQVNVLTVKGSRYEIIPDFKQRFMEAYVNEFEAFAQAIIKGEKSPLTVDDGIKSMKIADAANKSFSENGVLVQV